MVLSGEIAKTQSETGRSLDLSTVFVATSRSFESDSNVANVNDVQQEKQHLQLLPFGPVALCPSLAGNNAELVIHFGEDVASLELFNTSWENSESPVFSLYLFGSGLGKETLQRNS
jgi:hypothetical protein